MTEKKRKIHVVGINSYKFEDLPLKLQNLFEETVSIAVPNPYFEKDTLNLSQVIEKNRKIIKRYQAIVRTAVTLDALMDSENEEYYKIK